MMLKVIAVLVAVVVSLVTVQATWYNDPYIGTDVGGNYDHWSSRNQYHPRYWRRNIYPRGRHGPRRRPSRYWPRGRGW